MLSRILFVLTLAVIARQAMGSERAAPPVTGTVAGTVTYRADSKRPWRYARFYVARSGQGELAEAVVALRGKIPQESGSAPASRTVVVDQKNFQFTPETVAIRAGDSVKFTNGDQATHNVQATSDLVSFNTSMPAGGSQTVAFPRAGGVRKPVAVGCVFHSAMRAWVFVFDHPYFAVTARDGKFALENVPPGEYDLELHHPAGELRWRSRVTVHAGETTPVEIALSPDDKPKSAN